MFKFKINKKFEIDPDEIFLDSRSMPDFDTHQFEGRLEKSIPLRSFIVFGVLCFFIGIVFLGRAWNLQISQGKTYAKQAENNSLKQSLIFASRGSIMDRNEVELAWNNPTESPDFPTRSYIPKEGFGHVLGFIKYPTKDKAGFYYREESEARDGAEKSLDYLLAGKNGLKLSETDVGGNVISESVIDPPINGQKVTLAMDSRIQEKMYSEIKSLADRAGFTGGAGIIMDVHTGEILTMTSYPEYEPSVMTEGASTTLINSYSTSKNQPFLNRLVAGLYAPGSIVKPFLAFGALEEGIITPEKQILSTGKLVIPNPYYPDQPSIFLDWKAHGLVDMRHAIGVSSDVYFYEIGGGYADQKGLGIANIEKYLRKFGFAAATGIDVDEESIGNIPNPAWKEKVFGEAWNLGNTYHTAIGQYGTQVTPIQAIRAIAAVGNGGTLVTPTILKVDPATGIKAKATQKIEMKDPAHLQVAQEGMRLSITEGTSLGLNVPYVHLAGKTGTAEIGVAKDRVNSWTTGYFPYENPRYAYMVVMENGPVKNLIGATSVMRIVMDYMHLNTPEYIE